MGWFDEQIRQRKLSDDEVFADSFADIAGAVAGRGFSDALKSDRRAASDAIGGILEFYHIKFREPPKNITDINEQLEYLMRPYGVMRRTVRLEKGWYKDAMGAMLAVRKDDGGIAALIPSGLSGYRFFDRKSGKYEKVGPKNEELFDEEAICFYKPFPLEKMNTSSLLRYMAECLQTADLVLIGLATLAVTLLGLLGPKLNNIVFSDVVESGSVRLVAAMLIFLICVAISTALMKSVQLLLMARISTKLEISVQSAAMMRILSLPASFFKKYSSGELYQRTEYINDICGLMVSAVLSTGLTSVFSLTYLSQIFIYAPSLAAPALLVIFATLLLSLVTTLVQARNTKRQMEAAVKESGVSYALISGVQKIKLSGAEKRAFAHWGKLYAKSAELSFNPPLFLKVNSVISTGISLAGTIAMYYLAVKNNVGVADYYACNTAYGMVTGAFMSLSGVAHTIAQIKPVLDIVKPILETVPEIAEDKQVITRVSGAVELNNVSFRYSENMPWVLDDLSLKIRPGQYVAVVGKTGCGKSTLMRLLLGFEKPQKGAVYYDGRDLDTIDLKSLRSKIGVVMQNGKLFQGDIYSNIVISAPWLTMDSAWVAAEMAGIADDIRRMPMGMHTLISEGSGGISGGQRQRLMIARAIAPKPRILMFDEATSALDNLTQKTVSDSLGRLKCTRIVIAHRLSTIRQCDRILVLDQGKIIEDGTYEELLAAGGSFAELVARQRLDGAQAGKS